MRQLYDPENTFGSDEQHRHVYPVLSIVEPALGEYIHMLELWIQNSLRVDFRDSITRLLQPSHAERVY